MSEHKGGRRRKHADHEEHEEHVNHEAWVIPYADMLTLLMALFLMLYAMSTLDMKKFDKVALGLTTALNPTMDGGAGIAPVNGVGPESPPTEPNRAELAEMALQKQEDAEALQRAESLKLTEVEREIARHAETHGITKSISMNRDPRGLVVTILSDKILFAPGAATIEREGISILGVIARSLTSMPNQVIVEGHTDDTPINTGRYPSNWELSTARATSVLRTLVERYGLSSERVSAAGYGDERPVASNSSAAGRSLNRRVALVVISRAAELEEGSEDVEPDLAGEVKSTLQQDVPGGHHD